MPLPSPPGYADGSLADVLPSVAASLGVPGRPGGDGPFAMPPARRGVVVLVDGLGARQLSRRYGHAPFLRAHRERTRTVPAGFPSTTATSMGTFGTGLTPGQHGMLGYEVLVPDEDRVFNELSWEGGPDPERWQPRPTWFERAEAEGVDVARIGPGFFDGSGLTQAALRGGRFLAADLLAARVDAALRAVRSGPRTLVYLYWGEVDKLGHVHGPESLEWTAELEAVDRELARLAAGLPDDASLTMTADHGMLACPHDGRVDVADEPALRAGVRHLGGEPRVTHVYCEPGAAGDVADAWREVLGDRAHVVGRDEAVRAGLFGRVAPEHLARVGDVVAVAGGDFTIVDSRRMRPQLLALLGMHGALTAEELEVPVLHVPARVVA
ncbi:alkaline phosphatase family protein [Phycicoccus sp. BSK3Z-2]|uniref:Alkaline phosphatase family protein n=1 Tax=Phycicoccus avicenniae TaxID=2828860 RepID=A0A941DAI5_9MICO|nr:nucleotide pyrophosphatase/phosphodiesterase family protein [Phycicoccus avicenniae]MBR7743447.1 alkaline phosphatase family protein [Phycicoccus avicenniae]